VVYGLQVTLPLHLLMLLALSLVLARVAHLFLIPSLTRAVQMQWVQR
jgi:hypothetical protein